MARARGANAQLAGVLEATYGTPPLSGFYNLPFVSSNLGEEQALIDDNRLGQGREPGDPVLDVANDVGDVVVPVDLRYFGVWLKLFLGAPVTTAAVAAQGSWKFGAQPAANATLTANGTVYTFVTGTPTGTQVQIGANLAATMTALATALNAGTGNVALATYTSDATSCTATYKTLGPAGNTYTLAAAANSNATPSGATMSGGANTHVFSSGALALPSMSLEVGLPEVPSFGMNYGVRGDMMKIAMARSGLLNATLSLIAQGETLNIASLAGTLGTLDGSDAVGTVRRFAQATGDVQRAGVDMAHVVSADMTFANNLDKVEVIRPDSRIEDADPGQIAMGGNITLRFADTTLLDQATSGQPNTLSLGWTRGRGQSLLVSVPRFFVPKPKRPITGPGGVQLTCAWKAAKDPASGKSTTVTLTNDVTGY